MKPLLPILLVNALAIAACSSVAGVQKAALEDEHAAHHPGVNVAQPPVQKGEAPATPTAMMERMRDRTNSMHELMARIRESKDPAERRQLMVEHRRAMHEQMQMMHGMGRMMETQNGSDRGPQAGHADAAPRCQMMQDQQAMKERMDMMESLIEQMRQYEEELEEEDEG
jgi:hypothetical protein